MDTAALAEFVSATVRPSIAMTLEEGGPPPEGTNVAVIAAASPIHATAVGSRILRDSPMRTTALPATLPFDELMAGLTRVDPAMILGYPSLLDRLATEQQAGRLELRLRRLTSSSENLTPEVRARIEQAFGVPVIDLYGSTEGLVGLSAPGQAVLDFASDGCIVEPVDEHDRPVGPGEPSASVLITNLSNQAQPLIRYRIEDCFVPAPPAAEHGHFRALVDGRTSDTLRWDDVTVHPLTVTNELIHTPAVVDYVVHQTPSGVAIGVVTVGAVDLDGLGQRIAADLAAAGKADPEVTVRAIDDVGRNPRTGKVARIIPLSGSDVIRTPGGR
jgi:phenylacetate-coenzyme A ligase PaaK-like adenylate-forming protein